MEWLWRRLLISILFAFLSIYNVNKKLLLSDNQASTININQAPHEGSSWDPSLPLPQRKWDRMLFGICTYDSPKEAGLRKAARETSLNYYKYYANNNNSTTATPPNNGDGKNIRSDTICSLKQLMSNMTLARDPESCRIVYTFVMGGGIGDEALKKHARSLGGQGSAMTTTNLNNAAKTRCLYDDPDCGGRDIKQWTLDTPQCNVSDVMTSELQQHDDITVLRIPENHELGKTDTWFTYMAMLTHSRPDLQIGFVGKCDSDNLINWPVYLKWIEMNYKQEDIGLKEHSYIYGGYIIHKNICSGRTWGRICSNPSFIAQRFAPGAIAYISTPLAQHVYMNGTSLEQKIIVWILGEDLQLGNMVYSDPSNINEENGKLKFMNHRYGEGGGEISNHPLKTYDDMRNKWFELYPDQKQK